MTDWAGSSRDNPENAAGRPVPRRRGRRRPTALELVTAFGDACGHAHGWKVRAARKAGVHPTYISKILAGKIPAGACSLGAYERLSRLADVTPETATHGGELDILAAIGAMDAKQWVRIRAWGDDYHGGES